MVLRTTVLELQLQELLNSLGESTEQIVDHLFLILLNKEELQFAHIYVTQCTKPMKNNEHCATTGQKRLKSLLLKIKHIERNKT